MDLARMTPRTDLASSKYCLARPGVEYLVYLPKGGEVTVDLSAAKGKLTVEWVRPTTGKSEPTTTIDGGKKSRLRAPFGGDAVVRIFK